MVSFKRDVMNNYYFIAWSEYITEETKQKSRASSALASTNWITKWGYNSEGGSSKNVYPNSIYRTPELK